MTPSNQKVLGEEEKLISFGLFDIKFNIIPPLAPFCYLLSAYTFNITVTNLINACLTEFPVSLPLSLIQITEKDKILINFMFHTKCLLF